MSNNSYHIMVVDDEVEIATGLAETLAALTGHQVVPFSDPYRALQSFLKQPYHLVITDISMPNIDGFELLHRMREQVPVCQFIVVTAHKTLEIVSRSRRLGAARVFFKPVDIEQLEKAVQEIFEQHQYWNDLLIQVEGR